MKPSFCFKGCLPTWYLFAAFMSFLSKNAEAELIFDKWKPQMSDRQEMIDQLKKVDVTGSVPFNLMFEAYSHRNTVIHPLAAMSFLNDAFEDAIIRSRNPNYYRNGCGLKGDHFKFFEMSFTKLISREMLEPPPQGEHPRELKLPDIRNVNLEIVDSGVYLLVTPVWTDNNDYVWRTRQCAMDAVLKLSYKPSLQRGNGSSSSIDVLPLTVRFWYDLVSIPLVLPVDRQLIMQRVSLAMTAQFRSWPNWPQHSLYQQAHLWCSAYEWQFSIAIMTCTNDAGQRVWGWMVKRVGWLDLTFDVSLHDPIDGLTVEEDSGIWSSSFFAKNPKWLENTNPTAQRSFASSRKEYRDILTDVKTSLLKIAPEATTLKSDFFTDYLSVNDSLLTAQSTSLKELKRVLDLPLTEMKNIETINKQTCCLDKAWSGVLATAMRDATQKWQSRFLEDLNAVKEELQKMATGDITMATAVGASVESRVPDQESQRLQSLLVALKGLNEKSDDPGKWWPNKAVVDIKLIRQTATATTTLDEKSLKYLDEVLSKSLVEVAEEYDKHLQSFLADVEVNLVKNDSQLRDAGKFDTKLASMQMRLMVSLGNHCTTDQLQQRKAQRTKAEALRERVKKWMAKANGLVCNADMTVAIGLFKELDDLTNGVVNAKFSRGTFTWIMSNHGGSETSTLETDRNGNCSATPQSSCSEAKQLVMAVARTCRDGLVRCWKSAQYAIRIRELLVNAVTVALNGFGDRDSSAAEAMSGSLENDLRKYQNLLATIEKGPICDAKDNDISVPMLKLFSDVTGTVQKQLLSSARGQIEHHVNLAGIVHSWKAPSSIESPSTVGLLTEVMAYAVGMCQQYLKGVDDPDKTKTLSERFTDIEKHIQNDSQDNLIPMDTKIKWTALFLGISGTVKVSPPANPGECVELLSASLDKIADTGEIELADLPKCCLGITKYKQVDVCFFLLWIWQIGRTTLSNLTRTPISTPASRRDPKPSSAIVSVATPSGENNDPVFSELATMLTMHGSNHEQQTWRALKDIWGTVDVSEWTLSKTNKKKKTWLPLWNKMIPTLTQKVKEKIKTNLLLMSAEELDHRFTFTDANRAVREMKKTPPQNKTKKPR
eukprot:GHVS01066366.1.p1 GENE.GHVS01066366.1~~GHVS01066366.1.p1  ORF type:complete len:1108 (-),score=98.12 GHVS01066366.1:1253-4576(-)